MLDIQQGEFYTLCGVVQREREAMVAMVIEPTQT